jgi:hypothetical protein
MVDWPANPVGSLSVETDLVDFPTSSQTATASFNTSNTQQVVSDLNITFTISIELTSSGAVPALDYFSAELYRQAQDGSFQSVDFEYKYLPADQKARNGKWDDTLALSDTMPTHMENYRVRIFCCPKPDFLGQTTAGEERNFQAIFAEDFIGDFTLDFVPVTIVYCPLART